MNKFKSAWRKASASAGNGQCVEMIILPSCDIAVRDSKNPAGGCLVFSAAEITAFFDGVRKGEFDDMLGGDPR